MARGASTVVAFLFVLVGSFLPSSASDNAGIEPRLLEVDATNQPSAIETGYFRMGTAHGPKGTLEINNRYLTLNGRPWAPVMGEFHYSRFPSRYWLEELAKMKAAGVDVVATYVIWNHQEETAGKFNWSGDRDLRRFIQLCGRLGLKAFVRIGPWDHGEARFGGIPDWVVQSVPTRGNDPTYLRYAAQLYNQIGKQLHGLLWKSGGPVIGIQVENEYNLTGPGQGREHISELKRLARAAGLDVPLYTVTGWDQTIYPAHEVTPVFGGYPDEPWDTSTTRLPPKETYLFRFKTRVAGNMGAQTHGPQPGDAESDREHTPFFGAEYGGGLPSMYRRRAIVSPDDIGAMWPVQLGSGVNLYGYYMFHGGLNPKGNTTLEEQTLIGNYNDVPIKSYDFQAPLGEYGQMNAVLGKIRPYHYFLNQFGSVLAPMSVHAPKIVPADQADLKTPRYSVRSAGDSGFLFVNNYIRQYSMQEQKQVRFLVHLPSGDLTFPNAPIDIPSGTYFIWPFNLDIGGAHLVYATAQLMTRVGGTGVQTYVFRAVPSIATEFVFDSNTVASVVTRTGSVTVDGAAQRITVAGIEAGANAILDVKLRSGGAVQILVLTEAQAEQTWQVMSNSQTHLIITDNQVFADLKSLVFRSKGNPSFHFAVFPSVKTFGVGNLPVRSKGADGAFALFEASAVPRNISVRSEELRPSRTVPPLLTGGTANSTIQPYPEVFGRSAAWTITIPKDALKGVSDAVLEIDYKGDVGRLFSGTEMMDDHYYFGPTWEVGLKRFAENIKAPLTLTVLPLRRDAPIYIEGLADLPFDSDGQIAALTGVKVVPIYDLSIRIGSMH